MKTNVIKAGSFTYTRDTSAIAGPTGDFTSNVGMKALANVLDADGIRALRTQDDTQVFVTLARLHVAHMALNGLRVRF